MIKTIIIEVCSHWRTLVLVIFSAIIYLHIGLVTYTS